LIGKPAILAGGGLRAAAALLRISAYPLHEAGSTRSAHAGLAEGASRKLPTMAMTA